MIILVSQTVKVPDLSEEMVKGMGKIVEDTPFKGCDLTIYLVIELDRDDEQEVYAYITGKSEDGKPLERTEALLALESSIAEYYEKN